jgi:hypothetical protein
MQTRRQGGVGFQWHHTRATDGGSDAGFEVGNSLAVRLPKALVEKMGLNVGDELNIVDVFERTLVVQ